MFDTLIIPQSRAHTAFQVYIFFVLLFFSTPTQHQVNTLCKVAPRAARGFARRNSACYARQMIKCPPFYKAALSGGAPQSRKAKAAAAAPPHLIRRAFLPNHLNTHGKPARVLPTLPINKVNRLLCPFPFSQSRAPKARRFVGRLSPPVFPKLDFQPSLNRNGFLPITLIHRRKISAFAKSGRRVGVTAAAPSAATGRGAGDTTADMRCGRGAATAGGGRQGQAAPARDKPHAGGIGAFRLI